MIGLMNGWAHGHANRPFQHPVASRLASGGADHQLAKLGEKLADKLGVSDAEAGGGQTTINYTSFNANFQSGPDGFSLSVSIVNATISIGALDAANGDEAPEVIDGEATPVEDVPDIVVEDPDDDDRAIVSEGAAGALYEKAASGEAALEILEDMTEPEEDILI